MGFLTATSSISRYHIDDALEDSVMEKVREGLTEYAIPKIENEYSELSVGWVPFEGPYDPDFEKYSFVFGTYFLFNLRVDKKSVPAKLVKKHVSIETARRLEKSGREFISKNEKAEIKEEVLDRLLREIPSVPNIYEVLWNYEEATVYLYTTQKAANEIFETLFSKSFTLKPIRLFPYTMVEKRSTLSDKKKDLIYNTAPAGYSR